MEEREKTKQAGGAEKAARRTYTEEELNAACTQLYQRLVTELQKRDLQNAFTRLEFLFKVLGNRDLFHSDFVGDCVDEIEKALKVEEPAAAEGQEKGE